MALAAFAQDAPATNSSTTETQHATPSRRIGSVVAADEPYKPLTSSERWRYYWQQNYLSPAVPLRAALSGALLQADNRPHEWGQGAGAFGKRTASQFGRMTLTASFESASMAALGHEIRYTRCRCTSTPARLGYAIVSPFLTRNAQGHVVANFETSASMIGGNALALTWMPDSERSASRVLQLSLANAGSRSALNVMREFLPDIKRVFRRK